MLYGEYSKADILVLCTGDDVPAAEWGQHPLPGEESTCHPLQLVSHAPGFQGSRFCILSLSESSWHHLPSAPYHPHYCNVLVILLTAPPGLRESDHGTQS